MLRKHHHRGKSQLSQPTQCLLTTISIFLYLCLSYLIFTDCFFGITFSDLKYRLGLSDFSLTAYNSPFSIHFIDVGHGDSILVRCGENTALIDTGKASLGNATRKYLQRCEVKRINLLIVTHTDSDHIGDFSSIADYFPIDNVFLSQYNIRSSSEQTETERMMYAKIKEHHIKVIETGINNYSLGDVVFQILSPGRDYQNKNDNSLVVRILYKNTSFLLMADAGQGAENDLINSGKTITSDVLKVSHHGSKTATSQAFINKVAPKTAIVSVGNEEKSLPDSAVMQRLKRSVDTVLTTLEDGNIIISSDGTQLQTFTDPKSKVASFQPKGTDIGKQSASIPRT